jgi:hypothetical protein
VSWLVPWLLVLFGVGFLAANVRLGLQLFSYRRRRASALLVWDGRRPRHYGFSLALGVLLGLLLIIEIVVLRRPLGSIFGESMMFLYYGYTFPLSTRIKRGFYADGVWSDGGFMPWSDISAMSWREGPIVLLVLTSRTRVTASRLEIPGRFYGQARRLLRDKVSAHDVQIGGAGLGLGRRDERDAV